MIGVCIIHVIRVLELKEELRYHDNHNDNEFYFQFAYIYTVVIITIKFWYMLCFIMYANWGTCVAI